MVAKSKKRAVTGSEPVHALQTEYDVLVPMRDGVRLAIDITRPKEHGKFPALVAAREFQRIGDYGRMDRDCRVIPKLALSGSMASNCNSSGPAALAGISA